MRRRLIAVVAVIGTVTALQCCSGKTPPPQKFADEIASVYAEAGIRTQALISTNLGGYAGKYRLRVTKSGKLSDITVIEPLSISGITATFSDETAQITFDETTLETTLPQTGELSPLGCIPVLMTDFSTAVPFQMGFDTINDEKFFTMDYNKKEDAEIQKRIWFDMSTVKPVKAEVFVGGELLLSCDFELFEFTNA